MKFLACIIMLCSVAITLSAQQEKKQNVRPELRKGNKLYNEKKYKEAQEAYVNALKKDPTSYTGMFNLSDALYNDKNYEQARQVMASGVKHTKDKKEQARALHNIGNTFLQEKKWEEAANTYKQSLRLDPTDADTKYNLAYANAMIKKDGGKDKNKDKDKKDQDKQEQDKKEQDKKDQEKKDQDKKDGDKEEDKKDGDGKDKDEKDKQDQPKPQAQPSKLSQQQAENLLNALRQEEKKLQDKKEKGKGVPVKLDKDW